LKPAELRDEIGVTNYGLAEQLADNGGDTLTLAVPAASPVVGAGTAVALCPAVDQRDVARPIPCTVGAYEPEGGGEAACGDASEAPAALVSVPAVGRTITASDALIILSAAVDFLGCQECVCDVDGSGGITATDALIVLKYAVGQLVNLSRLSCS
jgi:hypothetical protein